ncbi:MAG: tRNA pseudouridine(55) synthase TruB [Bacteroidia bacterium]|nr:tRNA pseudouridine(55) synthase TruB [Bacteroidia bacterium]MDW8157652.1 tRNA pseudouridine(55) synthase TruB [Bacteroidia bacterium]
MLNPPYRILLPSSKEVLLSTQYFEEGCILLINKPKGWTSFDVVAKLRNLFKIKKIGHSGTLDPLATGLLIIATGKYTKLLNEFQNYDKQYLATFCLGAITPSYDAEYEPLFYQSASHITPEMLETFLQRFRGEIEQIPPPFSAIKIGGKRAYELARQKQDIQLRPRKVHIYQFIITAFHSPENIQALIYCSKGTYIRSLIHDLGQALGVGAYLKELQRTHIGTYSLENAWEIQEIIDFVQIQKQ